MTDGDRIAEIGRTRSVAKSRRLVAESPVGFEAALLDEVRRALGSDPSIAASLSKAGEGFTNGRACWAHRFRAVRHRLEQRWLASANEFLRAEAACADEGEGAAMAVGAIDSLARAGRVGRAVALARRLISVLEANGRGTDAGRAALNLGNALLWHDRVQEAIPVLENAVSLLSGSPVEQAGARLGLSTAQIDYGTAADVRSHAERAVEDFRSLGLEHYALLAEQNVAYADLMSGRLDDALQRLLRLKSSFPHSGEEYARNEQHLGETYLRLNMPVEARQAFMDSLGSRAMSRLPFNQAQCRLGLAEAAFALDRPEEGADESRTARRLFRRMGNEAAAALATAAEALGTLSPELRGLAEELDRHGFRRKTAEVLFALAESAGDSSALERGDDLVRRHALIDLEWRGHAARARLSFDEDRLDSYRKMADAMWQSRALQRSTTARQHFLRDKDGALREYLGFLLDEPTSASVDEALQVLSEARSISLIDEIVFARRDSLTPEQTSRLQAVRDQLREATGEDGPSGARRGGAIGVEQWRRAWYEASEPLFAISSALARATADVTYVRAGGSYHKIVDGRSVRLSSKSQIEHATKWLSFDVQEPLVVPMRATARLERAVASYCELIGFEATAESFTVLPDEALWRAPWPLLAEAARPGAEPIVSLAPAFRGVAKFGKPAKAVTVWYQESDALPHIRREVEEIKSVFPTVRLCSSAAEVRESLACGETDVLHVATHAAMNNWNPMFSHLQFSDGPVFAAEIARGSMRPRLVTMSACDTGSVSAIESNEPDGLVRAALAMGAESVVASAWPLDDRASAIFTLPYYRTLRDGGCVLDAVRQGRSAVRSRHSHPYYWGAMVVFGGYLNP